jgi:uncharacterized protein YegP (UPF0339 family)
MGDGNVDHVVVYRDKSAHRWRWRAVAGNGEIVSEGEAHTRPEDAARAARGVLGEKVDIRLVREELPDGAV